MISPDFWAGRRVLVTGHTGFKGAWLSLWLSELGAEVVGISDAELGSDALFALAAVDELLAGDVRADVRDAEAMRAAVEEHRPEVVLHLAAQALVRPSYDDPVGTFEVNVVGTAAVLDAVRRAATPPLSTVVVTSDKCYENREWPWAYREDEPMGGKDPYSASKGAAELVVASFRRSYGLPLASARAGNVIGGGDRGVDRIVPDAVRAVESGGLLEVRRPDAVRPWQHVLNPLSGYLTLAQAVASGDASAERAFNFGPADSDARTVGELVGRLSDLWEGALRWRADDGEHPPEATFLRVDSSLARQQLGWRPAWDVERSLAETVAWHRADPAQARATTRAQIAAYAADQAV